MASEFETLEEKVREALQQLHDLRLENSQLRDSLAIANHENKLLAQKIELVSERLIQLIAKAQSASL